MSIKDRVLWQGAQHPEKMTGMKPEKSRTSYLEGLRSREPLSRLGDSSMSVDSLEVIKGEEMADGERSYIRKQGGDEIRIKERN